MRLIYLSLSWIAGVWLGTWAGFNWIAVVALSAFLLVAFLYHPSRAILLVLCCITLVGGILRFQSNIPSINSSSVGFYNDKGMVRIKGMVAADPEAADYTVALRLETGEVEWEGGWRDVSGVVLVYVPQFPAAGYLPPDYSRDAPYYRYGDVVQLEGSLEPPPLLDDFDWQRYLSGRGIYSIVRQPDQIELLAEGQGFKPREWLYNLRYRLSLSLDGALHEPQDSLAQAILLGKRSTIPEEVNESLSRTGTTHVMAISGLHVAIVGGIVLSAGAAVFGRRRPWYFMLAIAAIWGYAALTGLNTPALRAAIMVSLWLFADYIGRPRSALTVLLFTAALMVGIRPSILSEASFQLSFGAIAGLILLMPYFQSLGRRIFRVPDEHRRGVTFLIDSVSATLGAVLATLPLIAYYFHQISFITLPANILVLPVLPGVIITSALVGVVGLFVPALAQVLGWIAWLFLSYMIETIEFLSRLPFASTDLEHVGAWFVWTYYAVLAAGLWLAANRARAGSLITVMRSHLSSLPPLARRVPVKFAVFPLLVVAALIWVAAVTTPDNRLHVYVLDVGQGDAILIQRGHTQVLIDGGPDGGKAGIAIGDRLPFWDRTIELVISTHPDADHITGLVEVLRRYDVKQVLTSGQERTTPIYAEWLRLIEEKGLDQVEARAGQRIELAGDMVIDVLHPDKDLLRKTSSDIDNNSVVLRLTFQDFSLLLTGDIFEEAEQYLLRTPCSLRSTVLKVAHHGSSASSSMEFLTRVEPLMAIVSAGAQNQFKHPSQEVKDRLNEIVGGDMMYNTAERGTVELITDGQTLFVRTER